MKLARDGKTMLPDDAEDNTEAPKELNDSKTTAITGQPTGGVTKESAVTGKVDAGGVDLPSTSNLPPNDFTVDDTEKSKVGKRNETVDPKRKQKEEILNRIREIEEEFGHNLSDIPINHEYWDLMNTYRRV